jgi:hypothetical protein
MGSSDPSLHNGITYIFKELHFDRNHFLMGITFQQEPHTFLKELHFDSSYVAI